MLNQQLEYGIQDHKIESQGIVLPFPKRGRYQDSSPVVNLGGLYDRNPAVQRSTAGRIGEIAMENGFFYISNHGVSQTLIEGVYEQAEYFFASSAAEKMRYYIGESRNHRGYVPVTEKGDYIDEHGPRLYEAFDMGVEDIYDRFGYVDGNPLLGPNTWPDQVGFKLILMRYLREMDRLVQTLCWAFETVLELEHGFFQQFMQRPVSQLRLLHYFKNEARQDTAKITMGAHTDYECFTILHSRTPSLQVLGLNSEWMDAPPIDDTFYFNIGDMLEAWSGGLFVATPHRVVNNGNERFSIPFFAATDFETVVSSVSSTRFASKQRAYKPIIAGHHLLSQLMRDFPYLKNQYEEGRIHLPISNGPNPFETRIKLVEE